MPVLFNGNRKKSDFGPLQTTFNYFSGIHSGTGVENGFLLTESPRLYVQLWRPP